MVISDSSLSNIKFTPTFLGQRINTYEVPLDVWLTLNHIYETQAASLPIATNQLVGKIKKEYSVFNAYKTTKMKKHNVLPPYVLQWFEMIFVHYLKVHGFIFKETHLNSIWINEMDPHEYNPIHTHQGRLFTGLSSVMMLKIPQDMGPEIVRDEQPSRGTLQLLGNSSGDFCKTDFAPTLRERSFHVFPYDMRHCVYPHNNPTAVRRTLAANMDVQYDPVKSRQELGLI